jgi:glutamine amidotransferase
MPNTAIAIIDYGMGNIHSVTSALAHISPDSDIQVSADPRVITMADKVIFPGVGAIGHCMAVIRRLGFDQLIPELVAKGKPLLGICVGMQALLNRSEENKGVDCLGLFSGGARFFGDNVCDSHGDKIKVPHMGWNRVTQSIDHALWQGIDNNTRFYFVHSYYADADNTVEIVGSCDYGEKRFAAALCRDNLFAVQFHPEKSHVAGLQFLRNFVEWKGI